MIINKWVLLVLLFIVVPMLYSLSYEEELAKIRLEKTQLQQELVRTRQMNTIYLVLLVMLSLVTIAKL